MLIFFSYLLILFITLFPLLANARPVIEFTKEQHYAGEVRQGIKINNSFEFINKGDSNLIIKKLVPS